MKKLQGIPLASGLALGRCSLIEQFVHIVSKNKIKSEETDKHLQKFEQGIQNSLEELKSLQNLVDNESEQHEIIQSHQEILKDEDMKEDIRDFIKNELYSVETAVHTYFEKFLESLSEVEDEYLSLRKTDFIDIKNNLMKNITGREVKQDDIEPNSIVVVKTLAPSLAMKFFEADILGLVVEKGSKNSHAAILAKSIGIPVIYDVKDVTNKVDNCKEAIIYGDEGSLVLNPDKQEIEKYNRLKIKQEKERKEEISLVKSEAITRDNKKITVMGNIELAQETSKAEVKYSDGVGLFRTEFLYFLENKFPDVEQQAQIYKSVVNNLSEDKPVFIRVFDIGGDKLHEEFGLSNEENPNLGLRGIRLLLEYPKIFKDQITGILRASHYGNIKIMLPMISKCEEVIQAKQILEEVKADLKKQGIPFNEDIELGVLIEVPSAAIVANKLAEICDFFSIGTNDLTQYVLAIDRNNEKFGENFSYFHRAIIVLMKQVIDVANDHNIPVGVCGEMASDPIALPLLLGMGMTMASINLDKLLPIKK